MLEIGAQKVAHEISKMLKQHVVENKQLIPLYINLK